MPANRTYTDGSYDTATAVTLPVFEFPFAEQGVNEPLILRQDFVQELEDYAALALNTAHPDYADYYLVNESPLQDLGGGVVQWTRTYARVPDTFQNPAGNFTYTFIGFRGPVITGTGSTVGAEGRERFTENVPAIATFEFFLVGPGEAYEAFDEIPVNPEQKYYYQTEDLVVDYIGDSPPLAAETTPSRTEYDDLIAADAYNIVVEPSRITRWMGNIFQRETIRIKAK